MEFDPLCHPFHSRRTTVFAKNGMVSTSQPLAAQAGLSILRSGGNAIDAAIATAACLTVVEPTSNGIGGDAFALVWTSGVLHGLNASGPAPQALSISAVKRAGHEEMPSHGLVPVTVPGVPAAWAELSRRFGRLPLRDVLQSAITYAEQGYPISPTLGKYWQAAFRHYSERLKGAEYAAWFETFAPLGRAPRVGEMWRSPGHARTLREIADSGARSFYDGELSGKIDRFCRSHGGYLSREDLRRYAPEWVEPIRASYRGHDVWEIPPNGQGLVALIALQILEQFSFTDQDSVHTLHHQIEAIKLALADGLAHITDAREMTVRVEDLLTKDYARKRSALIGDRAANPAPGQPAAGGTVYLAAADGEGNMVSYIQSNYMGFGSGVVVPGTGISLQNRGHTFSLNPADANALVPGKKTYHTIIPGFLTRNGQAIGPFGVMGAFMQPQGHVQVIMNTIDFRLNPQAALDAPRWQWISGKRVDVERGLPEHVVQSLAGKGHDIHVALDSGGFGRGQIIWRDGAGVFAGGTEPRTDGAIAAW